MESLYHNYKKARHLLIHPYVCYSRYRQQIPVAQVLHAHSKPSMAPLDSLAALGHRVESKDLSALLSHHNRQHHLETEIQPGDNQFQMLPTPEHLRLLLRMDHSKPSDHLMDLKWYVPCRTNEFT